MAERRFVRERVAGQSAMERVVAAQAQAPARTPVARLFGVWPLVPGSRAAYRAALAELLVGRTLEQLGSSWDVLHDLPLTRGGLDHLAIGPAGVFAVRAVQCEGADVTVGTGRLTVGSELRDDLAFAQAHAVEASGILGVAVQPLLVLVGARRLTLRGVASVVRSEELLRSLSKAARTLSGTEVAAISDLADQLTTWPRADAAALDTQQLHRDFAAIRDEVSRARNRRTLWLVAAFGALFGIVWVLLATFVGLVIGA